MFVFCSLLLIQINRQLLIDYLPNYPYLCPYPTQNSKLKTQNSKLKTYEVVFTPIKHCPLRQ